MNAPMPDSLSAFQTQMFDADQYRMVRLQVFNWGTFDGYHSIDISPKGHLVFGSSGSGKSTLLDAITTLLVPRNQINFNAAAREGERSGADRSMVTYLRGAWGEHRDEDSGHVVMRYLRGGQSVWAALALTYRTGGGRVVQIMQTFWIRGASVNTQDIRRHFLVLPQDHDLTELQPYARDDFKMGALKALFPRAILIDSEFKDYSASFRQCMGIESDKALRLLNKTQGTKNLGDLNTFMREFMLDRPSSFEEAEGLVEEFDSLNRAHEEVVRARDQVNMLQPARSLFSLHQEMVVRDRALEQVEQSVDVYAARQKVELLKSEIGILQRAQADAENAISHLNTQHTHLSRALLTARERRASEGGLSLERLALEKDEAAKAQLHAEHLHRQTEQWCAELGLPMPAGMRAFAALQKQVEQDIAHQAGEAAALMGQRDALVARRAELQKKLVDMQRDLEAMKKQTSNLPVKKIQLRAELAQALGVDETTLPFVGELIDVKPDDAVWQGAIERLLGGFSQNLLVPERYIRDVSSYINGRNIGQHLAYTDVPRTAPAEPEAAKTGSVLHKISIRSGVMSRWLESKLAASYDYHCAASPDDLGRRTHAITREGLIKHGARDYVKNDSHGVDDRRFWVLGFDNKAKIEAIGREAQKLMDELAPIHDEIARLTDAHDRQGNLRTIRARLRDIEWHQIDHDGFRDRIRKIEAEMKTVRKDNPNLDDLTGQINKLENETLEIQRKIAEADAKKKGHAERMREMERQQGELRLLLDKSVLVDSDAGKVAQYFAELESELTLLTIESATNKVRQRIIADRRAAKDEVQGAANALFQIFVKFSQAWPAMAANVDQSVESARDYLAILDRLERDGLPKFEQNFARLLRNQSQQRITSLNEVLRGAYRDILQKLEPVNDSLRTAPFGDNTYLQIELSQRQLPDVVRFREELKKALDGSFEDTAADAEARFCIVRDLVNRLGSKDPLDMRWRDLVLDVRQHVEFVAVEWSEDGKEIETFRSGAGKSGGQKQKLATTCLAAALRYQLGGRDGNKPVYAAIVLDEAFDKADRLFTMQAMNIFINFGFQMIVATPSKSIMTLEPFAGGATFVTISERSSSSVFPIGYDTEGERLDLPASVRQEAADANA